MSVIQAAKLYNPNKMGFIRSNLVPVEDQIACENKLNHTIQQVLAKNIAPDSILPELNSAIQLFLQNDRIEYKEILFSGNIGKYTFNFIRSMWIQHPRFKQELLLFLSEKNSWLGQTVTMSLCSPHYRLSQWLKDERELFEIEAEVIGYQFLIGEMSSIHIMKNNRPDGRSLRLLLDKIGVI